MHDVLYCIVTHIGNKCHTTKSENKIYFHARFVFNLKDKMAEKYVQRKHRNSQKMMRLMKKKRKENGEEHMGRRC